MKSMIIFLIAFVSFNVSAKAVSKSLTSEETQLVVELANNYQVPLKVSGPCNKVEFDIIDSVKGFNPAVWSLNTGNMTYLLEESEATPLVYLFDRVEVPSVLINSFTQVSRATVTGSSCGFNPYKWTISFDDLE
ncbi:hypothetical protein M902_0346 [Bacteriovorax sp. BAL6_X]|uniref:hypothetical protein n=1 Tax=Bacteriovorax sp. BAL6_X TaxID=1201290 RepID=UPI0003859759|nr:hypothetical protein [Bacteriovorax sp. BAL6_X]EPZ50079.1 hypothetical protein M902_0346 [Bacteriovorax sp. BAL6_X]